MMLSSIELIHLVTKSAWVKLGIQLLSGWMVLFHQVIILQLKVGPEFNASGLLALAPSPILVTLETSWVNAEIIDSFLVIRCFLLITAFKGFNYIAPITLNIGTLLKTTQSDKLCFSDAATNSPLPLPCLATLVM